jgi:hypothetical protein
VEILRRTFEAAKHPKGSAERQRLNWDAITSEYMTSHRYAIRHPFLMSDGTQHPTQPYLVTTHRTKAEAIKKAREREERGRG